MKYFDTHCHTNISPLLDDFEIVLDLAIKNDLGFNIVGVDLETSLIAINQAKCHPNLYCTIGIHPNDIIEENSVDHDILALEKLYIGHQDKVIAIGECGIDLYCNQTNLNDQIVWFQKQIELANKYHLPVMVHTRNACEETIKVIKAYPQTTFIIHCFSSNLDELKKYQALGCYISIPGIITFNNAKELNACIPYLDLDKLITETDSPYLTPVPERGTINNPNKLIYINQYLCEKLNLTLDEFNHKIASNISNLFKINL